EFHLTCISDATGEAAVAKIVKASYLADKASDGVARAAPLALDILSCRWAVQGFSSVKLLWDHTTDDVAMVLSGSGFQDFTTTGGKAAKCDPRSAGGTGDLLLTSTGASATATYDISIVVRKSKV
ncbi:hypothetical protein UFOVP1436_52, partial [uncultured Caudovirales phage]